MSKFLTENFDVWGHILIFGAENTRKSRPFKIEINAQTLPKQLSKSPEKDFFDHQNCQNQQIFDRKFRFSGSFIHLWS